jgi:threonine-phosphate decarboxylase
MTIHGGDVWHVSEKLGIPASEILDFSANINPRGLPLRARERLARDAANSRLLSLYPDPSARSLREALSGQIGVPADAIVIGPGAESLLAPILRSLRPHRTLVPIPAFSEYRRVCEQQQIEFVPFLLDRADWFRVPVDRLCSSLAVERCGVALLNNPHNPSGAMLAPHEIRRVRDAVNSLGGTLLVDEAFVDYVPRVSLVHDAAADRGLIVVRSLTKFYGCPALRVGYAVAHPEVIRQISSLLPTWPVTQLAMDTLAEATADHEYTETSILENAVERERLGESLRALGLVVFPSSANYLFLELAEGMRRAPELRQAVVEKHRILIRNCDSYEGLTLGRYVRVAVRSATENDRLIHALGDELRRP